MLNVRALNQQFEWVNPARFWNDKLDTLVIKALLVQNRVHLVIEMFVDTTPEVDDFFERCCDILIAGRRAFAEALNE